MDPTIARMRRQPSRPAHEISGPATGTLPVDESAANQRGRLTGKIVGGTSSDSPALQRDVANGVRLTVALKPSHRVIADPDDLRIGAEQEIFFAAALSYIHEKSDVHSASGRITWDRHDDNTVHANFKCGIAEKVQAKFDEASRAIWGLLSGSTPPGVAPRPNGAKTGAALNVITDMMEPDGDTNVMAVPLAVPLIIVGQLTSIADWFDLGANKDKAFRNLLEHQAGASKYFYHSDTASLADANSYLVFMENAKQIPKLCANARMAMESGGLALARDTFIAVPSGILSAVASLERALRTVTTTIGAWFGMVTGAASIVSGGIDAAQGVTEYGVAKATIDASVAKRSVVQARVDKDVAERGGEASDLLTTINFTYQLHQTRAEKKTEVAAKVAVSKIFRGSLAAAVGTAFLGVAIATAAGVALAYLGVPLLVLSLAITVVFAVGVGIKAGLDRKDEKASANRQCKARDIIQTHTRQELLAKYKGGVDEVLAVARGDGSGGSGPGIAAPQYRNVHLATNEYLALHFTALALSDMLFGVQEGEESLGQYGPRVRDCLLRGVGMTDRDLEAFFRLVRAAAPSDRLEFIKKRIATACGFVFRVDADGREAKTAPDVLFDAYFDRLNDDAMFARAAPVAAQQGQSAAEGQHPRVAAKGQRIRVMVEAQHRRVAEALFPPVDRDEFLAAAREIDLGKVDPDKDSLKANDLRQVLRFAEWVEAQREIDEEPLVEGLAKFDSMLSRTKDDLRTNFPGMTSSDIEECKDFFYNYAGSLKPGRKRILLSDAPAMNFVRIWTQGVNTDPDLIGRYDWGKTLNDAISKMPLPGFPHSTA